MRVFHNSFDWFAHYLRASLAQDLAFDWFEAILQASSLEPADTTLLGDVGAASEIQAAAQPFLAEAMDFDPFAWAAGVGGSLDAMTAALPFDAAELAGGVTPALYDDTGVGASGAPDQFWSTGFSAGNSNADNSEGYVSVPGYGPVSYGM
jgi:hypothetical protein